MSSYAYLRSDTAVVRGALLQGLKRTNPDLPYAVIESKVPEMSYGIERWVPYDANRHDSAKKLVRPRSMDERMLTSERES